MKALSIKQPWASLIAHGIKDIENRTWRIHFRGKVYIHASGTPAVKAGKTWTIYTKEQHDLIHLKYDALVLKSEFETSRIIGEVEIIDCVINHPSIWSEKTEVRGKTIEGETLYKGKPIYNWVLANPVLYDKPIFNVKGKLSFWEPTPNQICMSCEKEFFGQEAQYCCSGHECGCMGRPVEPVVCSEECYSKLVNH